MSYSITISAESLSINTPHSSGTMEVDIIVSSVSEILDQLEAKDLINNLEDELTTDFCLSRVTIEECIEHFGVAAMREAVIRALIYK